MDTSPADGGVELQITNDKFTVGDRNVVVVTPEDAPSIIAALNGGETTVQQGDLTQPFFTQQMPIVLENSGKGYEQKIKFLNPAAPAEFVLCACGLHQNPNLPGVKRNAHELLTHQPGNKTRHHPQIGKSGS